eukprot:TRINITY_DN3751_c0_g1_i2.p1 TRINITY_DN3751_c0_g1~~TRINITY_DN3751_c0_g1_i2.p1  ORF type:complete len:170 (+),score=25.61 TRINITY_DN3751_c0_g1_i2:295-804(+)
MAAVGSETRVSGKPLKGNWFEEIRQTELEKMVEKTDYTTMTNATFSNPTGKEVEKSRVGPRQRMLEQQWREQAKELVKTVAEPPRVQRYKTTAGVAYGREKANLGNTLLQHNMGRTQGAPSYTQDQPVTVYTSRKGHYGSAQTGRNPFAKNTRFSAPIDEFVEADAKDL